MSLLLLLEDVEEVELPFATDRGAIRLRWNGAATERAFIVRLRDYQGGDKDKPAAYRRNVRTGQMLRVYGVSMRQVSVELIVKETPAGNTIEGVQEGSIDELETAWAATDLECLSFEDTSYWYAEWVGGWPVRMEFDPMRTLAIVPMHLQQRSTT